MNSMEIQCKSLHKTLKTLKDLMPKMKDKIYPNQQRRTVYKIPCKDCDGIYISETGRAFQTHLKEHQRDSISEKLASLKESELCRKQH